jgi:nucleotide-binding universal stress UspA family protein
LHGVSSSGYGVCFWIMCPIMLRLPTGEPVDEIMKLVAKKKIDLIIMAAHDEVKIEHIVFGRFNH